MTKLQVRLKKTVKALGNPRTPGDIFLEGAVVDALVEGDGVLRVMCQGWLPLADDEWEPVL